MAYCSLKHKFSLLFAMSALIVICSQPGIIDACSSRSIPKPRNLSSAPILATAPPTIVTTAAPTTTTTAATTTTTTTTTPRPNITFPTYKCPGNYDAWYCLNDATCFSVKLGDSVMYNCECANGFMGPRCEYKEIDASFLPKRPRPILEKASIASGATCALLFVLFLCLTLYLRYDQSSKVLALNAEYDLDVDDADEDVCFAAKKCRYCHEGECCTGVGANAMVTNNVEPYGGALSLRSYIEAISMSFAIKRTTKL